MTAKAQLQSAGDGTAIPAGSVGQVLESQSSNASVTTSSLAQIVSLTLTSGTWLVQGTVEMDGAASCTGIFSKFYTKNIAGSVRAKDFIYCSALPSSATVSATFIPRVVNVSDSDSDKTVALYSQAYGATTRVWGVLSAIRIA